MPQPSFRANFFPEKWAAGTGVPPSFFAEELYTWGLIGGFVAIAITGLLLVQATAWLTRRRTVLASLLLPFLAAATIALMKGGTDNFSRTVVLQFGGCAVVAVMCRLAGTKVGSPARFDAESVPEPRRVKF